MKYAIDRIEPRSGWVLIDPIQEEVDETSLFMVPESTKEISQYMMGYSKGNIVVFPRHMMIEIEYKGRKFNLIEEKYIIADIEEIKN